MLHGTIETEFPAYLKDENGAPLAEGRARVSRADRTVTFTADFVPLYPVGTPMQVVRVNGGREIHRFFGQTYLSDKHLLRLVSVEDEVLPGAEEVYCTGLSLPARVTVPAGADPGLLRRLFSGPAKERQYEVTVTSLTRREAEFLLDCRPPLEEGSPLHLAFEPATGLPACEARVIRSILFGPTPAYRCALSGLSAEESSALQAYLRQWAQTACKCF